MGDKEDLEHPLLSHRMSPKVCFILSSFQRPRVASMLCVGSVATQEQLAEQNIFILVGLDISLTGGLNSTSLSPAPKPHPYTLSPPPGP